MRAPFFYPLVFFLALGCGSRDERPNQATDYPAGLSQTGDKSIFATGAFEVPPGKERFICYILKVDRELFISAYSYSPSVAIHHASLVRMPDGVTAGFHDCDGLEVPPT